MTLGGTAVGPGNRGSGVRFSSDGEWQHLFSGAIAGGGRWISLPEEEVAGEDYEIAWSHVSGITVTVHSTPSYPKPPS